MHIDCFPLQLESVKWSFEAEPRLLERYAREERPAACVYSVYFVTVTFMYRGVWIRQLYIL